MTAPATGPQVMVVGSGWRFTSGISYYTCRLTNALATATPTTALLIRQLVPTRLYPGRGRVGRAVNELEYSPSVRVFDGLDWFWGPSMRGARRFVTEHQPDVLVLQWWTGAVLHSYLRLASMVKRYGGRVVLEWHEVQDTGEARIPGVTRYVTRAMQVLLRKVDGHVVHSRYDLELLRRTYDLPDHAVQITPHGPYDHHADGTEVPLTEVATDAADVAPTVGVSPTSDVTAASADVTAAVDLTATVTAPAGTGHGDPARRDFVFLYFGVIRPYKGVEDLVAAFDLLPADVCSRSRLVLVGETWEGWTAPLDAVAASPNRDRIDVVNRYVDDAEVTRHFAAADAVVLPYRRSSASGPLHIAMSSGLPVVVSQVGGLVEAAGDYAGVSFVPPADPDALAEAMAELVERDREVRFTDPHSWDRAVAAYGELLARIGAPSWVTEPVPAAPAASGPAEPVPAASVPAASAESVQMPSVPALAG